MQSKRSHRVGRARAVKRADAERSAPPGCVAAFSDLCGVKPAVLGHTTTRTGREFARAIPMEFYLNARSHNKRKNIFFAEKDAAAALRYEREEGGGGRGGKESSAHYKTAPKNPSLERGEAKEMANA